MGLKEIGGVEGDGGGRKGVSIYFPFCLVRTFSSTLVHGFPAFLFRFGSNRG